MNRTVSAAIPDDRLSRRSAVGRLAGAGAAAAIAATHLGMSRGAAQAATQPCPIVRRIRKEGTIMNQATPSPTMPPLTVVLVHGAFADASGWAGVIPILQAAGVTTSPPRPTRSAASPTTPPTSPASRARSPARSCWSATPTAARSSPTPGRGRQRRRPGLCRGLHPGRRRDPAGPAGRLADSVTLPALRPTPVPDGHGRSRRPSSLIDPACSTRCSAPTCRQSQTAMLAVTQRPLAE